MGNTAATFTKTGDKQKGAAGSQLTLSVTLIPGQSGGSASGATVFFTTNAGSLASRIVDTDSTGQASVVLTLPSTAGSVRVTAEGQYALGHPSPRSPRATSSAALLFRGDSRIISASARSIKFVGPSRGPKGLLYCTLSQLIFGSAGSCGY